ncbi:hypothetical protein COO60DRAFT_891653 [Scenedesmus sp. NREL 46B-D3]|nr:hypothetical protein COO60DRAFT_891653 [Scenedesmus sp. NREL 46B-D3]
MPQLTGCKTAVASTKLRTNTGGAEHFSWLQILTDALDHAVWACGAASCSSRDVCKCLGFVLRAKCRVPHNGTLTTINVDILQMLGDRRPAMASGLQPQPVTQDSSSNSNSAQRGVWQRLKSATTAPVHALDRLMFPDEPIAFVRTSAQAPVREQQQAAGSSKPATQQAGTSIASSTAATELAAAAPQPQAPGAAAPAPAPAASAPASSSNAASVAAAAAEQCLGSFAGSLSAAAEAAGGKLTDGLAAARAALPAPGWPAARPGLQRLSQPAAAVSGDFDWEHEHWVAYAFVVFATLFSTAMWGLAVSMSGGRRWRASCGQQPSSAGCCSPAAAEEGGAGSSAALGSGPAHRPP